MFKSTDSNSSYTKYLPYLILILLSLILSIFSETSDLFNGIGSDGFAISHFSRDLVDNLRNKTFLREVMGKLFPISIVSFIYNAFFEINDSISYIFFGDDYKIGVSQNIVIVCKILNFSYLTLTLLAFFRVLRKYINDWLYLLFAMVLIFGNFMFLKQFYFEPVFLDQFSLFLSTLFLYSMEFEKKWLQRILLFLSIFSNTILFLIFSILSVFDNKSILSIRWSKSFIIFVYILFYLILTQFILHIDFCTEYEENPTLKYLLPISVSFALVYMCFMLFNSSERYVGIGVNMNVNIIVIAIAILSFLFLQNLFTFDSDSVNICVQEGLKQNLFTNFLQFVRQANSRPAGFLSSHFNYFGLIIPIMILKAKLFNTSEKNYDILLFPFVILSLTSESRYLSVFIPFLLITLVKSGIFQWFKNRKVVLLLIIFNVMYSGVFNKINPLGTNNFYNDGAINIAASFEYPLQKYFKNLGPWTSNENYYIQLIAFAIALALLKLYFSNMRNSGNIF